MARKKRKGGKSEGTTLEAIGQDGAGKPAVTVHVRSVVCPRCKSPKRKQFKDGRLIVQDFGSMHFDPVLRVHYNRIILRMTQCLGCGQKLRVKEFTMKPEKD